MINIKKMAKEKITQRIETIFVNNAPNQYIGRLSVKIDGRTLWSLSTNIARLTKKDALKDLANLRAEIKEKHCI